MGTLIGLREPLGVTYADHAARHGLAVAAASISAAFPAVLAAAPPLAFPGLAGAELERAERRWWGERIDAVLAACGSGPAPRALHHDLYNAFAAPALWQVYPDVPGPLARWQAQGLRLAVVSNFDQRLPALLEGLGLAERFEAVVISSSAGAAKPSPLPFQRALEALDLAAAEVWHLGDSDDDVRGARAAGLRAVCWLRR
ncbi:MAG: HAD-IA family hydrolase [Prochlorococcaceae cyanobacterium]